jgi:methylmalonyl-CoA/ethylmalonyl-CoA epimerase
MRPVFQGIKKVGVVVKDVNETVKTYADEFSIGPWRIWELDNNTASEMMIDNKGVDYSVRIARTMIGSTIWELIEPLDDKTIFSEFLRKQGEGLHHLGYEVKNIEKAINYFRKKDIVVTQSGNWSGYKFAYLDTARDLKHVAEIYSLDKKFSYPEPAKVYGVDNSRKRLDKPLFKAVRQVGIAVKDIRETAKVYYDKYRLGPWEMYKYYVPKVTQIHYHEKPTDMKFTTAATMMGDIELELMEPEEGENIYTDHINAHGEGLQHVSFLYNYTFDEVMKMHHERGHKVRQRGTVANLTFAYIGTEDDLKIVSEILDIPSDFVMFESDFSYPDKKKTT